MSIGAAIVAAQRVELALGPLLYRCKAITSADLLRGEGAPQLLASARKEPEEQVRPDATEAEKANAAKRYQVRMARLMATRPELVRAATQFVPSVLAAGLEAASADQGATWEPLRVVMVAADRDPAANRLLVEDLPAGHAQPLVEAILRASEGGVAAERLASFLAGHTAPAGAAGADVRNGPVDHPRVEPAAAAAGDGLPRGRASRAKSAPAADGAGRREPRVSGGR